MAEDLDQALTDAELDSGVRPSDEELRGRQALLTDCGAHSGRYPNPDGVCCTRPHHLTPAHSAVRDGVMWAWVVGQGWSCLRSRQLPTPVTLAIVEMARVVMETELAEELAAWNAMLAKHGAGA